MIGYAEYGQIIRGIGNSHEGLILVSFICFLLKLSSAGLARLGDKAETWLGKDSEEPKVAERAIVRMSVGALDKLDDFDADQ